MTSKEISYKTLQYAINVAFSEDEKIISLYDPTREVATIDEVKSDIYRKIREYDVHDLHIIGVYEKNELVGYFVYKGMMLISFSLKVEYRTRPHLREFYSIIRKAIGNHFICFLWTKNARGIKWLLKNGMEIINHNQLITQLICP